jgi:universal stress protein E
MLFVMDHPTHVGPRLLRKLAELARGCDAELELYQPAFEWSMYKGGIGSVVSDVETRETLERRHGELEGIVGALRTMGVRVRGAVSCEKLTCENILAEVCDSHSDLLIVQSRPRSAIARLLFSSTDFKLIEHCLCPLLLMKTEKAYLDACVLAAIDPTHAHDKPATLDEAILDAGTVLARALGGDLHICHALAPVGRFEARARVEELARRFNVREARIHVAPGHPAETIIGLASWLGASIVAMGAVSRSALERVTVGHTAERVLDALNCDVLVVKPPGFRVRA